MTPVRSALLAALFALAGCASIPPIVTKGFADNLHFIVTEPVHYSVGSSGEVITVPRGFVTDFASVPRLACGFLTPHDRYSKAAVIHDYLYWTQQCTREQADNLLLIAMKESGVSATDRWAVHRAVRAFGKGPWESNRKEREAGLPRILREEELAIGPDVVWDAAFRESVRQARGGAPEVVPPGTPRFCGLGDSEEVPTAPPTAPQGTPVASANDGGCGGAALPLIR